MQAETNVTKIKVRTECARVGNQASAFLFFIRHTTIKRMNNNNYHYIFTRKFTADRLTGPLFQQALHFRDTMYVLVPGTYNLRESNGLRSQGTRNVGQYV